MPDQSERATALARGGKDARDEPLPLQDVEGLIERLAGLADPREYAASDESGPMAYAEAASALRSLQARVEELERGVANIANADHHIVSGSPGPLFNAGWNAGSNHIADQLRALLASRGGGEP